MSDLLLEMPACDPALLDEWSAKLRVCGHPTRWKILCLIERQSACVTDLWHCLDQPQPVVSQHLAALKEKGIVESSIAGNKRLYFVSDPMVRRMVQDFLAHAEADSASANSCPA
jgi:DNA-binding transcriptional ArsR family regulator